MRFSFLLLKLAMTPFVLSGCFSTGYQLARESKNGGPIDKSETIELQSCTLGVAFDKYTKYSNSSCAIYLGFSNVVSNGDSVKITGINASVEDLDHPDRVYSLSNVYWNKFIKSGVGDRLVFIDSAVKNPVPFTVPFGPSNSTGTGNYYAYDHYSYACAFKSVSKRKALRKAKVTVTVNFEWKGKAEARTRSFLFERYRYFLFN